MKKEELEQIGLNADQIKSVFEMNGKDVNAAKEAAKASMQVSIDDLKAQLQTATDGLKKFDGINPEELNNQIQSLNQQLATQKSDYEAKIADRDFNDLLSKSITEAGGRNVKAITALLDVDKLKSSKNQKDDISANIESVKKKNDYLFASNEPINNPVGGTGSVSPNTGNGQLNMAAMRAAMGLPAEKK